MNRSNEYIAVAREFVAAVRRNTDAVREVILFGSVARGEATEQSDIDVALVVDRKDNAVREAELEAGEAMMNKHGTLFGCVTFSTDEWARVKRLPFGQNLLRHGIPL